MDMWMSLLQTFGLAVAILVATGFGIWRMSGWLGREIVIPARDTLLRRCISFFDTVEGTVSKLDRNVDAVTENLRRQTGALESLETMAASSATMTESWLHRFDESAARRDAKLDQILVGQQEIKVEFRADVMELKRLLNTLLSLRSHDP